MCLHQKGCLMVFAALNGQDYSGPISNSCSSFSLSFEPAQILLWTFQTFIPTA